MGKTRARILKSVTPRDLDLIQIDLQMLSARLEQIREIMEREAVKSVEVFGYPTTISSIIAIQQFISNVARKIEWSESPSQKLSPEQIVESAKKTVSKNRKQD